MRRMLLLALVVLPLVAAPAGAWTWPVDGLVLHAFVFGDDPYAGGQHRGIDVGAPTGASVRAAAGGEVTFAGAVPGLGLVVTVRTADGYAVTHAQLGSLLVDEGRVVAEGDTVGTVGASNEAATAEPHVHLGVRVAADEHGYVDPLGLLPARVPATPPEAAPPPAAASVPIGPEPEPVGQAAVAPTGDAQPPMDADTNDPGPSEPSAPVLVPAPATARPAAPPMSRPPTIPAKPVGEAPPAHGHAPRAIPHASTARSSSEPSVGDAHAVERPRPTRRSSAVRRSIGHHPQSTQHPARSDDEARTAAPVSAPADERPHAAPAPGRHRSGGRRIDVPAAVLLAGIALAAIAARRRRSPIIDRDVLLRDDTDLLRERDAAHRARVHDDRRGHPRPASPSARGGDVLPDGGGRACGQGRTGRCGAGTHAPRVHRSHRRRLARAPRTAERGHRLLHQDDR